MNCLMSEQNMMPLQDAFGRIITSLRVSLTDRCNLRCRYCMPETGVKFVEHAEILRYEEFARLLNVAARRGISKIRVTGGEPLVRKGAVEFIARISRIPGIQTVTLTTNGVLLAPFAAPLRRAGLSYLNVSLDTLNPRKFEEITRVPAFDAVLRGIRAAKEAGFSTVKVNVVAMRGFNDDELFDFADFAHEYDVIVRFIEYMPFHGNGWQPNGFVPSDELQARLATRFALRPAREEPSAAAKIFDIPGRRGKIGFISAVSHNFCAECNRLRLTADGFLRPCLHGAVEIDVKRALRRGASDDELMAFFQEAADRKPVAHRDFFAPPAPEIAADRAMVNIGG